MRRKSEAENDKIKREIKLLKRKYDQFNQLSNLELAVKDQIVSSLQDQLQNQMHLNRACRKIMRSKRYSWKFCDKVYDEKLNEE